MPCYKLVMEPSPIGYLYDGSLPGLYCCLHACIYDRALPAAIAPFAAGQAGPGQMSPARAGLAQMNPAQAGLTQTRPAQTSLFPEKRIPTDMARAARVRNSIRDKISPRALELVETVFYSCLKEKELCILRFLQLGYAEGGSVTRSLGHPVVSPLLKAEKHLWGEQHLLLGFVRFSDYEGILAATITPKNFVLPFLANHFCSRFSQETFMIYDKTHKAALLHEKGQPRLVWMEDVQFNEPSEEEKEYRRLWKQFYHTIAIEARYNPKCRRTHMPMRYWENMTEMQ